MLGNAAPGPGLRAHGRGREPHRGWREVWRRQNYWEVLETWMNLPLVEGSFGTQSLRKWCGCGLRPAARGF
jgi:hypothetical protein